MSEYWEAFLEGAYWCGVVLMFFRTIYDFAQNADNDEFGLVVAVAGIVSFLWPAAIPINAAWELGRKK